VPVLWVGLPAIRGTKSTADMAYLDDLYRHHAEKAGIIYVDVWDGFVDESGDFALYGPDFEGQTRRLRTGDGVYFTKAGAVKLGHYVERELKRAILARATPGVLPAPEAATGRADDFIWPRPAGLPGPAAGEPTLDPASPTLPPNASPKRSAASSPTAPRARPKHVSRRPTLKFVERPPWQFGATAPSAFWPLGPSR
jgi:uncharacterized protein